MAETPDNQQPPKKKKSKHHRLWSAFWVAGGALALFALYFFITPVQNVVNRGFNDLVAYNDSFRTSKTVAPIKEIKTVTDNVKTDDGRAVIRVTQVRDVDPIAEIARLNKALDDSKKETQTALEAQAKKIGDDMRQQIASINVTLQKSATPAADTVTGGTQAPAQQQAPSQQAQPKAAGDLDIVIPKGFHVVTVGNATNQAKMRQCRTQLVLDTSSPQCFRDRNGLTCPWKCPN